MAYDAALGEVVLYGGIGEGIEGETRLSDTWTFDGTTWTERPTTDAPSGRSGPAMAYDAALGEVVLFGTAKGEDLSETWTFNGTNWTLQSPPLQPAARSDAAMGYDPALEKIVLTEGYAGKREKPVSIGETWLYGMQASPSALIDSPIDDQSYELGSVVPTSFSCVDGTGSPGISSCRDSDGNRSGHGTLGTSNLGPHTYTVTATSRGGQVAQTSISYTVVGRNSLGTTALSVEQCGVPSLGGETLKAAKRKLIAADCKLGKVKRMNGVTAIRGRVSKQSAKPGRVLKAGTKVNLTLS